MVDDEEVRVVGTSLQRLPGPAKEQDIADPELHLVVAEDLATPLDLGHHEVAALRDHAPKHAISNERRARRDHDLEEPALAVERRAFGGIVRCQPVLTGKGPRAAPSTCATSA